MAFSQHGALWVGFFNASFDKLSIRLSELSLLLLVCLLNVVLITSSTCEKISLRLCTSLT
jgi:hypothetical protein